MAELTTKERLQPSLLDRLTDLEPDRREESRERRVLTQEQLRESVRRDLTWLFNTTHMAALVDLDEYPEVSRAVLNFGVPDLAGHTLSSIQPDHLKKLLRQAILDFEPRLLRSSLQLQIVTDKESMRHNSLVFTIEAELWAQPVPLPLFLRTEFDLETGKVQVSEAGNRRGA